MPNMPPPDPQRIFADAGVFMDVADELAEARQKFAAFNSGHEGWAVIKEELDELWEEVRSKNQANARLYEEAKQTAAMAIRFMLDVCGGSPDGR